jgi:hypothetical protein
MGPFASRLLFATLGTKPFDQNPSAIALHGNIIITYHNYSTGHAITVGSAYVIDLNF